MNPNRPEDTPACYIDDGPPTREEILGRAVSAVVLFGLAALVILPPLMLRRAWRLLQS